MTSKSETVFLVRVNSFVANVHSVTGMPQKKGVNPNYCHNITEIKYVNDVSCVGHLSATNNVTNVPTVAINPPVGARLQHNTERGLHTPLSVQTQPNHVTNGHKQLCQPTRAVPLFGGTVSADKQKCN